MSQFRINGVLQASYQYDAMGRQAIRTLTSPTAITIHSVFDSKGRRIAEYNAGTGALIREYVWNGWDPIAVIEGGVISFVRADHIGRPVYATNASGVKVWTASYNPFGGVTTSTGTVPAARFPGQWFQSESGLHQNWMRDYDPTTGRYLQADPLGLVDGASVYGYVTQNPMMLTDPRGEYIQGVVGAMVVGAISNVIVGAIIENTFGDGCYSTSDAARDAAIGAALGPLGRVAPQLYFLIHADDGAKAAASIAAMKAAAAKAAAKGPYIVYQGIGVGADAGVVRYVGITMRDVTTRGAEHAAQSAAKAALDYAPLATGLTKSAARKLEQQLINQYGLGKTGGQLLNKINSIAPKNWPKFGIN
jgi:RHS repeat-associated protein